MKTAVLSLITIAALAACQQAQEPVASHETADQVHEQPSGQVAGGGTTATASPSSPREVTIHVGSNFEPASIPARKGETLRLKFHRTDDKNCGDEVIFKSLNLRRKLPVGQTTVVEVTPDKTGQLAFTCGMDMMRGSVVVQ